MKEDERSYARYREDLVTLRPGREHAWLDRFIETLLRWLQRPLPFVHVSVLSSCCSIHQLTLTSICSLLKQVRAFRLLRSLLIILTQETRRKSGDCERFKDVFYYSDERIEGCAVSIITMVILGLLIIPIWLLYHIISRTDGTLSGRMNAICIGTLLVSTLLFSAVLSLFTRARRHEILAAAAA